MYLSVFLFIHSFIHCFIHWVYLFNVACYLLSIRFFTFTFTTCFKKCCPVRGDKNLNIMFVYLCNRFLLFLIVCWLFFLFLFIYQSFICFYLFTSRSYPFRSRFHLFLHNCRLSLPVYQLFLLVSICFTNISIHLFASKSFLLYSIRFSAYVNIIEITLRHGCSPVNLLHIFRTSFLRKTFGWLLLSNVLFKSNLVIFYSLELTIWVKKF